VTPRIGILGYGRFGAALGELALQAGFPLRAFDPHARAPQAIRAPSASELVARSNHVVLAVPVPSLRPVLEGIRPQLNSEHVVLDVASVKLAAEKTLAEVLGRDIPWVATHPLFGPSALALGQRPLRVVVCPNPLHESAVGTVRAMYERMDCEVVEQDADMHDRQLARGHALTFFVAKGMLEVGGENISDDGPPSVQAMAGVVRSVRSDAGHLFLAIERDNPYAAQARRDLIEALGRVHEGIDAVAPDAVEGGARMDIPDLGERAPELRELRSLIDDVDRELVRLLGRRVRLARGAGRIKAERGHAVRDPGREMTLLADRRRWAGDEGLDQESVDEMFRTIVRLSRDAQETDPPE